MIINVNKPYSLYISGFSAFSSIRQNTGKRLRMEGLDSIVKFDEKRASLPLLLAFPIFQPLEGYSGPLPFSAAFFAFL